MSTNWIVVLTRNNLELTQGAVRSFRAQDIGGGVSIMVIDNGSTDATAAWLNTQKDLYVVYHRPARSVAESWNTALRWLFERKWISPSKAIGPEADYALVVNNDVVLRPDTYRWLVEDGGGFVTAVGTRERAKIENHLPPDPEKKRPHPDFSCYLIRRSTWNTVGPFDENFKIAYVEDQDYHLRMHRAGVHAEALELPFLHLGAQTVKAVPTEDRKRILEQAAKNREYFKQKYGFDSGGEEYYQQFGTPPPPEPDARI